MCTLYGDSECVCGILYGESVSVYTLYGESVIVYYIHMCTLYGESVYVDVCTMCGDSGYVYNLYGDSAHWASMWT